jgi:MFS family permease
LASVANIVGNLAAGWLLSRGVRRWLLLAIASGVMGLCALGIFTTMLPAAWTLALCMAFAATGGVIPATVLSTAPLVAPSAALTPAVVGVVLQGNNLGQLVGPIAIGRSIESFGWTSAAIIVCAAGLLMSVIVSLLRRGFEPRNR